MRLKLIIVSLRTLTSVFLAVGVFFYMNGGILGSESERDYKETEGKEEVEVIMSVASLMEVKQLISGSDATYNQNPSVDSILTPLFKGFKKSKLYILYCQFAYKE